MFNDIKTKVNIYVNIKYKNICLLKIVREGVIIVGMKYLASLLVLMLSLQVYAGEYEAAMSGDKDVLVYFYTPYCKSCVAFMPYYEKIKKNYSDLNCIDLDVDTAYGNSVMRKFKGAYVPYIVLASPKTKRTVSVHPSCAIDGICFERALKGFKSKKK